MSTDPYPEVSGDESGIVPHQGGRSAEWPKKIRTLTAAELDRLTIDSAGRFYWDGKLVNYEPPQGHGPEPKTADATEQSAMEIIDRAVYELDAHKVPEPIEGADLPRTVDTQVHRASAAAIDYDTARQEDFEAPPATLAVAPPPMAPAIRGTERVRLSLSFWQSLGVLIVLLCIAIGASGVAAYGWVIAHDWSCRIGLVKQYCPPPPPTPALRQPPRTDIPA